MRTISADEELAIFCGQAKGLSYQRLEGELGISHSTLQRRSLEISERVKTSLGPKVPEDRKYAFVKTAVGLSMVGQMSSRNIQEAIALEHGADLSHDTVLEILSLASTIAKELNEAYLDLKPVRTASFDEIFQNGLPILNFVDNRSAVTLLASQKNQERSGESWAVFIRDLKTLGLNADTNIGDGATGLSKGLKIAGASGCFVLDLFHCLMKCFQAKKKSEGICYALIIAKDSATPFSQTYYQAEQKMNLAIDLFDKMELIYGNVKKYAMLAHPKQPKYITADELLSELIKLADAFAGFSDKMGHHKKLTDARNYLKNHLDELTAYKKAIEREVKNQFNSQAQFVFDHVLPVIEYWDQYERSYENKSRKLFWQSLILETKRQALLVVTEDQFNTLLNQTAIIVAKYARSNSLVENINNQIRRYMDTYKRIPSWFCDLFSFYWNFRRFKRGKRAGFAPIELLLGVQLQKSWLDILLERFPYHRLRLPT